MEKTIVALYGFNLNSAWVEIPGMKKINVTQGDVYRPELLLQYFGLSGNIELELHVAEPDHYMYRELDHTTYYVVDNIILIPENAVDFSKYIHCYKSHGSIYGIHKNVFEYDIKHGNPLKWVCLDDIE